MADTMRELREFLRHVAKEKGFYAGVPMPLENETLVIHPSYNEFKGLDAIYDRKEKAADPEMESIKIRNRFWSDKLKSDVIVVEYPDGKITFGVEPGVHHLTQDLQTLGCADAWGYEQETKAMELLQKLASARQMRQYVMTGMFIETSKRSGVSYIFRKLKPTVAIKEKKGKMHILAALCMHPIAHYSGSWAGAMCPSDDVVAHLMMMRSDEHMYWRISNQHAPWRAEAGL